MDFKTTLLAHFLQALFLVLMLKAASANQVCRPGFTGDNCETDINDCLDVTCSGHGNCSDREDGYFCHCFDGFYGANCEKDAGPCFPNPCKNNGNCTQVGDSFKCKCTADHEGESCETVKPPKTFAVTLALIDRDYDADFADLTKAKTRAIIKDLGDIFAPFFSGEFSGFQGITFHGFFSGSLGVQFVITFQSTSNVNATSIIQALRRANDTNQLRFETLGTTIFVTEGSSSTTATPSTNPTESSKLETWIIIVIVAAIIALIIVMIIIILAVQYNRETETGKEMIAFDGYWELMADIKDKQWLAQYANGHRPHVTPTAMWKFEDEAIAEAQLAGDTQL